MKQQALYNRYTEADGSLIYLAAVIGVLAVQLVVGIVAESVKQASGVILLTNGYFNYAVMVLIQAVNFSAVAYFLKRKNTRPDYSIRNSMWLPSLPIAAVVGFVCLFGFYGLALAFDMFLDAIGYMGQTNIPFGSAGEIAIGVIVTVLIAPFCEELVYRDALLSGLKTRFPAWGAILLSGAAFSLMHMNPEQTVYQFMLGCVCATLTVCSRSAVPAMVVHATSNLVAVLMEVTPFGTSFGGFIEAISPNGGITALWIIASAVLGGGILFGLLWVVRKFAPAETPREYLPSDPLRENGGMLGKKAGKVFLFFGMGVCLLMWIFVFASGFTA